MLLIIFQVVFTIVLADFVAGIVHWIQDAYIRADNKMLPSVGQANTLHHLQPRHFTRFNWWYTSWQTLLMSAVLVLGAWLLGLLCWQVWLFALVSTNANQIHKWSHRTKKENGRIITFLQKSRIVVTPRHHLGHHINPKRTRYCPVTNLVNPVLDLVGFWNGVEWLLARMFRLYRKPDPSVCRILEPVEELT